MLPCKEQERPQVEDVGLVDGSNKSGHWKSLSMCNQKKLMFVIVFGNVHEPHNNYLTAN